MAGLVPGTTLELDAFIVYSSYPSVGGITEMEKRKSSPSCETMQTRRWM